jgi:cytoskeletal protein RodZ
MERRGSNNWLVAVLALAVGFLLALLIFGGDDNKNSSATVSQTTATGTGSATTATQLTPTTETTATATTTTATGTAPASPQASTGSCINLWNQTNNRVNQTFLVNVMSRQAVRVHVGVTSDVPPKCLVTIVGNDGTAYVFPEGGGTTFPYAQAAGTTAGSSLPAAQKISNALEQRDGTLAAR